MSDNPLETTATEAQPSNPVPASNAAPVIDVEKIEKAARLQAQREAQSKHDQQVARLHKEYQARERELRATAATRLQKAGYEADTAFDDFDLRSKARQFDELSQQAQQAAEWQGYVESIAGAYDLSANDPRLADATSAQDLQAKVKAAFAADAEKRKADALKEAQAARLAQAEAKVNNGDLDTLGGAPAASSLSRSAKQAQAKQELSAELKKPMPDIKRITKLRADILAK